MLFPGIAHEIPLWLWYGLDDFLLMADGARIVIQNATWNGLQVQLRLSFCFLASPACIDVCWAQGFQKPITTPLYVGDNKTAAGVWHSERGLTYIEVAHAGFVH